jgi:DNA-binding NarL/FixJ family response regulator
MVRILIADDHELVRRGLVSLLNEAHPEWEIVAEAADGATAIAKGLALAPNLAILDLSMPDLTGLDVARRLMEGIPGIFILILTMHAAMPILDQLRKAGVKAYLTKSEAPEMLATAVERIVAGEPFFASDTAHRLQTELESQEYIPAQFLLTPRELSVMRLLALGYGNKQVAAELQMSVRTAETHRASILAKLKTDSIGELVRIAMRDRVI